MYTLYHIIFFWKLITFVQLHTFKQHHHGGFLKWCAAKASVLWFR